VHFYGDLPSTETGLNENISLVGSREIIGQVAYDRVLNPKDQVALSYGYQGFDFSTAGTAFHSNVIQAMYGHRISGRMDFMISAGPQFTHLGVVSCSIPSLPPSLCTLLGGSLSDGTNHIGVAGRFSLRYRFPKTTFTLSYQRYESSGSGIFAGSQANVAHLDIRRPLNRVWEVFSDLAYSKNQRLQIPGSAVNASSFTSGYGGVGLHRQISRSLRGFVSYQFNILSFSSGCPVGTTSCSNMAERQVGSVGVDWSPRPIRID
jgi:hypothetical protein